MNVYRAIGKLAVAGLLIAAGAGGAVLLTDSLQGESAGDGVATPSADSGVDIATPTPTTTAPPPEQSVRDQPAATWDRADFRSVLTTEINAWRGSANAGKLDYGRLIENATQSHAIALARHGTLEPPAGVPTLDERIAGACDPAVATARVEAGRVGSASGTAEAVVSEWQESSAVSDRFLDGSKRRHMGAGARAEDGTLFVVYVAC